MKNSISIIVKKPCSEKFTNFSTTDNGAFCSSCEKEVIDFTTMSQTEILKFLCKNSATTCGRFKTSQLGTISDQQNYNTMQNFITKGIGALSFSLVSLCAISSIEAQESAINSNVQTEITATPIATINEVQQQKNYKITGTVLDEENIPLPGVSIVLKGTAEGVSTDMDGRFEFPKTLEANNVLVFSYIGYDTKEYKIVTSEKDTQDITIQFKSSDIELMGEVVIEGPFKSKKNIFQRFAAIFK